MSKEGFIKVTGGRVWYKIVGKKKGIPLIVLHGGPGSGHGYMTPLEDLSDDREVIFYDQLGCGKSDEPKDKRLWTVDRSVEELGQVTDALKLKEFHILGQSWGSALAICFYCSQPKGIKSLVLSDPYIDTPRWNSDASKLLKTLPKKIQKILSRNEDQEFVKTDEFKNASEEYYKRYVHRMDPIPDNFKKTKSKKGDAVYNYMWGAKEFAITGTLKNFDPTDKLPGIKVPVLFLCGRFDEATPETTRYYKSLIPGARMKVFENSAHLPHWTDRKQYMKTVQEFLNAVE